MPTPNEQGEGLEELRKTLLRLYPDLKVPCNLLCSVCAECDYARASLLSVGEWEVNGPKPNPVECVELRLGSHPTPWSNLATNEGPTNAR